LQPPLLHFHGEEAATRGNVSGRFVFQSYAAVESACSWSRYGSGAIPVPHRGYDVDEFHSQEFAAVGVRQCRDTALQRSQKPYRIKPV
jgi:hypothetical protein